MEFNVCKACAKNGYENMQANGYCVLDCEFCGYSEVVSPHNDMVHKPAHYTDGSHESIETVEKIIDSSGLSGTDGYLLGNVLKYALRAGKKGSYDEDCAKAGNYAHRLAKGEWA